MCSLGRRASHGTVPQAPAQQPASSHLGVADEPWVAVVPIVQAAHIGLDHAHAALRRRSALHKAAARGRGGGRSRGTAASGLVGPRKAPALLLGARHICTRHVSHTLLCPSPPLPFLPPLAYSRVHLFTQQTSHALLPPSLISLPRPALTCRPASTAYSRSRITALLSPPLSSLPCPALTCTPAPGGW